MAKEFDFINFSKISIRCSIIRFFISQLLKSDLTVKADILKSGYLEKWIFEKVDLFNKWIFIRSENGYFQNFIFLILIFKKVDIWKNGYFLKVDFSYIDIKVDILKMDISLKVIFLCWILTKWIFQNDPLAKIFEKWIFLRIQLNRNF